MSGPDPDGQAPGRADERRQRPRRRRDRGRHVLAATIAVALAAVIIAPIALSSGDLVAWARSPQGLGLDGAWPLVVFPATDDAVFFAAMSLAGPVLLHATVHRVRRWARTIVGEYVPARAHFGLRWLPGVAFRETLAAWKASVRVGIGRPAEAVAYVRERRLLASLEPDEAVRYALGSLGALGTGTLTPVWEPSGAGVHAVRVWLTDRGLVVSTSLLEQVMRGPTRMSATDRARSDAPAGSPAGSRDRRGERGSAHVPVGAPVRASEAEATRTVRVRRFRALTPAEQARVRERHARGMSARAIARETGIAEQPVRAFVHTLLVATTAATAAANGNGAATANGSPNGHHDGRAEFRQERSEEPDEERKEREEMPA